jgi:hypothetical protein
MQSLKSLQANIGSLFVTNAFLDTFCSGLATNIARTIGTAALRSAPHFTDSSDAAFSLASIIGAAHGISSRTTVTDEGSLEELLETIHRQFAVADECNEIDSKRALEILEHVFSLASKAAREALREVRAGYPTSGGDFAAWKHERF